MTRAVTEAEIDGVIDELPPSKVIPTVEGEPFYTMRVRLDGQDFDLRFSWNERIERWHMDIFSDDHQPLAIGIKIVSNWGLLRYYKFDARMPRGEMMAVSSTLDHSPPGLYDFAPDKRVQLIYFPTTDL